MARLVHSLVTVSEIESPAWVKQFFRFEAMGNGKIEYQRPETLMIISEQEGFWLRLQL